LGQFTGSNDPEDRPILNNTKDWGASGLDLGANCEHSDGRIYIFMSDVVTEGNRPGGPKWDSDSVSWIDAPGLGGHEPAGLDFTLPFEPTSLPGEREWRNCRALFYDGETGKGVCPAGDDNIRDGGHIPDGYKFVVPFESANVSGQHEWRRCSRCQIMFFELYPDRGVCPAGGRHIAGGARLVLPYGNADSSHQASWRFCQWCRGLFFDGDPNAHGACIAGGTAFRLHPVMSEDLFDPFKVAGPIQEPLNAETPTGAFSYDERMYVFIWIGGRRDQTHPPGSYLVSKPDPNHAGPFGEEFLFTALGIAPKGFWQVAPWCIKNADIPGLPAYETDDGLLLFGHGYDSGTADAVHLAWMPLRTKRETRLFGGRSGPQIKDIQYRTGDPEAPWSANAADAAALITLRSGYTSLSAAWLEGPRQWILLYSKANDDLKRQDYKPRESVVARIGPTPWDWADTAEIEIFNPCREQAYGSYMHWPGFETIYPDVLPKMDNKIGWSYGAFILNRYTKWHPKTRTLDLYYLLSLHRPYQTQVMFTKLHVP
jgi:hypothetical protein